MYWMDSKSCKILIEIFHPFLVWKYSISKGSFCILVLLCTSSIKHRWLLTVYPCGYRQYILHFSSGYLLSPGDFWHKIWNFVRTKTPLGFTICTYWAPSILLRSTHYVLNVILKLSCWVPVQHAQIWLLCNACRFESVYHYKTLKLPFKVLWFKKQDLNGSSLPPCGAKKALGIKIIPGWGLT